MSRIAAFKHFYDMFKGNNNYTRRAEKQLEKDYNWQEFWNRNKHEHDIETALALYSMQEAHSVFGKEGRGTVQRGLGGSLFFPFTSYAQQTMEVLAEQLSLQRGIPGLYAGLWTLGSYITLAGVAGIPAYDLWKTLYEEYQRRVNNRLVDAEMEMKESGVPLWARKGLLSTATGLDVSQRIGQDVMAQNILTGLVRGEFKLNEVGGVPGRTIGQVWNSLGEAFNPTSTKSPMELITPIFPSAVQDVIKAHTLATSPEDLLKTKTGKMTEDPAKITDFDVGAQAAGFNTLSRSEDRQQVYWQQRANQEFNTWKSRLSESVAEARYKMELGRMQGDSDKTQEGQEMLNKMQSELIKFARENNIPLDRNFWRGFNRNVNDRLWQKLNPGKIKKPTDQERRHIEAIMEDEAE